MQTRRHLRTTYHCSSYVFKDSIDRVYEALRNPECYERIFKKYNFKILSLRNESDLFDDLGACFRISSKQKILYEIQIIDSKNEDNYKMLESKSTKVVPFEFSYIMKLSLYWCNIMKQTVVFEEIRFFYPHGLNEEEENAYLSQMELRFNIIAKYLEKSTFNLNQVESVIINSKFDEVCEAVENWNTFIKLSPKIGDKVIIKGDYKKVGCKISLYSEKEVTKFTVVRNEEIEGKKYYELLLDQGKAVHAPKQYLKFMIINVNNTQTFLSFTHEFIEPIKYVKVSKMSKIKKYILGELKKNLENVQKNAY